MNAPPSAPAFPSSEERHRLPKGQDDAWALNDAHVAQQKLEREERLAASAAARLVPSDATEMRTVFLCYRQCGGGEDDETRMTLKLTLPPTWLDKPCSKLLGAFAKQYNATHARGPIEARAAHLAGADGVLFAHDELTRDIVRSDGVTLFVVDPTKMDQAHSERHAVSLHYKVQRETGVVVKSAPSHGGVSFGVQPKWSVVEVVLVKDGWLRLSRNEVEKYRDTHTFLQVAEQRRDERFVECWMPAEHMKPVIVNPDVAAGASVPAARTAAPEPKAKGLRPSERRALRAAGLDDTATKSSPDALRP